MSVTPSPSAAAGGPPALRDRGVLLVLGCALAVLLGSWWAQEGYNLADTVEYVDLAQQLVLRGQLDPVQQVLRPPAFPLLLAPLVEVHRWLGGEPPSLMLAARVAELGVSLLLVLVAVRLGTLLAGRGCGLLAGFLTASSPIFLRYGVDPLSDPTAGVLLALGCERLLVQPAGQRGGELGGKRRGRRGLVGGLLAGLAFLVSYKVLPLVGLALVLVLARDRWRGRASWLGAAGGVALALALGVVLDRVVYGEWGLSLVTYLVGHVHMIVVPPLQKLGLPGVAQWVLDLTRNLWGRGTDAPGWALPRGPMEGESVTWYLRAADDLLVVPALALLLIAVGRALVRPRWATSSVLLLLAAYLAVLSAKHGKSFRLWLPVLPLLAAFCASGAAGLGARIASPLARRATTAALCAAVLGLGVLEFRRELPRRHGAYWRAVAWIDAEAQRRPGRSRYTAAYGFATQFRHSERLQHVGQSAALWELAELLEVVEDPARRAQAEAMLRFVGRLDWLLLTENMLTSRPELLRVLDDAFTLEAAFFEPGNDPDLGPVLVLARRGADRGGRRFLARYPSEAAASAAHALPDPTSSHGLLDDALVLERAPPLEGGGSLTLLAVELAELPGDGLGWITWTWTSATGLDEDLLFRWSADDGASRRRVTRDVHPAYRLAPTSAWLPGEVIRCGRVLALPPAALERRGEPGRLGLAVRAVDGSGVELGRFAPAGAATAPDGTLDLGAMIVPGR